MGNNIKRKFMIRLKPVHNIVMNRVSCFSLTLVKPYPHTHTKMVWCPLVAMNGTRKSLKILSEVFYFSMQCRPIITETRARYFSMHLRLYLRQMCLFINVYGHHTQTHYVSAHPPDISDSVTLC